MDAGGLAQMSFNPNNNNLPLPGNSFASRGKASHISRLSVNPPPGMSSINEDEVANGPTPRTSRSHLLAGLRTARKDSSNAPLSAPYAQTRFGDNVHQARDFVPQTAKASTFGAANQLNASNHQAPYSRPEQILSPPTINLGSDDAYGMDPQVYQNLMATNAFLAQRQQMLQQQLMSVQAAAQQFQGMNLNHHHQQQQQPMSPTASQGGFYNQQLQNGMQPVVHPVPGNPGLYQVYNPMTGQTSYLPDQSFQQSNVPQSPAMAAFGHSIDNDGASAARRNTSSPKNGAAGAWNRHFSPPRQTPSPPQDVAPLPEPSANAFRPGHRKSLSNVNRLGAANIDLLKNGPRSPGFPQTPVDGTFGLGLGRAGEHPVRQPRGPPPLEELVALPTSKHEGSKNFATRQRRRALFSLVRAGNDRRTRPGSAHGEANSSSSDNETPVMSSDADSEGTGNSLSATSSIGSLKAAAGGAIGAEAKHHKDPSKGLDTFARRLTGSSIQSDEDNASGERKKTPMLVLTSAEKRRTSPSAIVN